MNRPLAYVEYNDTEMKEQTLRGVVVAQEGGHICVETLTGENRRETYGFAPTETTGVAYEVYHRGAHVGHVFESDGVFYTENGMEPLVER